MKLAWHLALAAVACSSASAAPPRKRRPPPPLSACAQRGPVLFSIARARARQDKTDKALAPLRLSATTLHATGGWTFEAYDASGARPARTAAGCLDAAQVAAITAELATAKWQSHAVGVDCKMIADDFTEYAVNGKIVWTAHTCGSEQLDDRSTKILAAITKRLDDASAPAKPLACTAAGAPIVELDFVDSRPAPRAEVKLFDSGAWTFRQTAEGQPAGDAAGCLAADALAKIKADLQAARWKVGYTHVACTSDAPFSTVFSVAGKKIFTAAPCSGELLVDDGARYDEIVKLLDVASSRRTIVPFTSRPKPRPPG